MTLDNGAADIQADPVGKSACPQCGHVCDLSDTPPFATVECPRCKGKFAAPGRLGHVVLLKLLGKGEMGATYKAYEKALGRNVAVKVMRRSLGEDQRRVDGFLAEARAVASLEHPNAVRLYSVGQEKGQPYLVMELIKGRGMDKAFSGEQPMEEGRALEIAIGVAKALAAAAEIGLVHGDVKPANIMIDEKGTPKLVDFGIARFGGGSADQEGIVGTPYYAAPEQVRRQGVDLRTDMYSLGATLFHALAGRPPFAGQTVREVLEARLASPAPDLGEVRPDVNPRTAAVVAHMLRADPDGRPATYRELLDELQLAYFHVTGLHTPEMQEVVGRPHIPVAAPVRPARTWVIAAAAAAMVVVGVGVWAIAFRNGGKAGDSATAPAAAQVGPLGLSPPPGALAAPADVTITCPTAGAEVRYSLDGSEPTEESALYAGPVRIQPGTTLRARAFAKGRTPSAPVEAVYARDLTTLADVVPLRTAAQKAWQKVRQLPAGEQFGPKLEECDTLHTNAEELYRQGAYGPAEAAYRQLLSRCEALEGLDAARQLASAAYQRAREALTALKGIDPKAGQDDAWRRAEAAFGRGDFVQARADWQAAAKAAANRAGAFLRDAAGQWEAAAGRADLASIRQRGGQPGRELDRALDQARAAEREGRAAEAVAAYRQALRLLPQAAQAARTEGVEDEKEGLLAEARKLLENGKYAQALQKVDAVLAIEPSGKPAADLKRDILKRLQLSVDIGERRKMEFVWVPAGTFLMGSPEPERGRARDEEQHEVTLTRPFYIGKCEVRRKEFSVFQKARKYTTVAEKLKCSYLTLGNKRAKLDDARWDKPGFEQNDDHPVTCVTWREAEEFCRYVGEKARRKARLPTEAEWEYACRAGTTGRFSFGDNDNEIGRHGNFADKSLRGWIGLSGDSRHSDGHKATAPVGTYEPNPWGLHDMHGNVAEWCYDLRGEYPQDAVKDPWGPTKGPAWRIIRGGSWAEFPVACRSAVRDALPEDCPDIHVGFRVVLEADK